MADENFDNEFDELEDFDFDEENESQPIEEENEENQTAPFDELKNNNTYIPPDDKQKDENSFDAEKNDEAVKKKVKKLGKAKKAKWWWLIPLALVLIMVVLFVGWQLKGKTKLNVCVLDKTVLVSTDDNDVDSDLAYRKHQGLFWLLNQKKIVKDDGKAYDYNKDYFGEQLKDDGTKGKEKSLTSLDYIPDLMYISDVYGAINDTYGYYNKEEASGSGFNSDDMSVVSYAYENNATVVGEMELFNSDMSASVKSQLESLFGMSETGWVGRYIYELQDFTDVPDWAPPLYEQQSGVEWQFSGPGILLVSNEGKIIVLEQKTDFNSKNLLQISINEKYKKEFKGAKKCNFYNWFELIEANSSTQALATFEFDVNATGMEKLKDISAKPQFVAITRKKTENKPNTYYFAGDFNDYVSKKNFYKFIGSDKFFEFLSYDNQGDISYFYWNFYNPLMTSILKEVEKENGSRHNDNEKTTENKESVSKINNDKLEVKIDGKWQQVYLKALSLNANKPGEKKYTRDYSYYQSLMEELVNLGANCVRAKDLMPAEFYRALYQSNQDNKNNTIYLVQCITKPDGLQADNYLSNEGLAKWQEKIETVIKAVHGDGSVKATNMLSQTAYFNDVSSYLAGVIIDPDLNENNQKAIQKSNAAFNFSGKYFTADGAVEGLAAKLCDIAQSKNVDAYGYKIPVGIKINTNSIEGFKYAKSEIKYNLSSICANDGVKEYFFICIDGSLTQSTFASNEKHFGEKTYGDAYAKYLGEVKKAVSLPLLVSGISASTNVGGATESEQANSIIAGLNACDSANCIGGVIDDLNDNWSSVSGKMKPFTVPLSNNYLWHDVADSSQTTGLVAVESPTPQTSDLEYFDDDRMQGMSVSANESYLYINLRLLEEIDYSKEEFFIGIDTYQRNDGDYYYSKDYTPTSLSGMEFVIRFKNKQDAGLYVIDSYDKNKGNYASKESYTGNYNLVTKLNYGGFRSGDNQFYTTGTTTYIRIAWSLLNVTDPSQKLVINNDGKLSNQVKTTQTNGFLLSLMIADKSTKDLLYMFPEAKKDPGYKTFKWSTWEEVTFEYREKDGFSTLKKYYASK